MKTKRYYLLLTISVISLGLLLTGGTFAWLSFGMVTVGNNQLNSVVSGFLIDYTASLNGELLPSKTYTGGLVGTVTAKINSSSEVSSATGSLYLSADDTTSSILYEGTEMGLALKYIVFDENDDVVASGIVNEEILGYVYATGGFEGQLGMLIYDDFPITKSATKEFTVYLWLDGNLVDNRYLGVTFSGALNIIAVQDAIQ